MPNQPFVNLHIAIPRSSDPPVQRRKGRPAIIRLASPHVIVCCRAGREAAKQLFQSLRYIGLIDFVNRMPQMISRSHRQHLLVVVSSNRFQLCFAFSKQHISFSSQDHARGMRSPKSIRANSASSGGRGVLCASKSEYYDYAKKRMPDARRAWRMIQSPIIRRSQRFVLGESSSQCVSGYLLPFSRKAHGPKETLLTDALVQ